MLSNRWAILALLFLVRVGLGLQFESVAALSPLVMASSGVGIEDIGLLIGLFHAPGVLLALPGGAIGRRFGDKRVVMLGLALMCVGGVIAALSPVWSAQVAARILSGVGGTCLNVLMTKMASDWFAGKEIATALAVLLNSWPVGIALALVILPPIAGAGGLAAALLTVACYLLVGLGALALFYRPAEFKASSHSMQSKPLQSAYPVGRVLRAVLAAGLIWGLYNAALSMVFAFGPLVLTARGWTIAQASSTTSVVLWLAALSVPAGGIIADRTGRASSVLIAGFLIFAVALMVSSRVDAVLPAFVVLGLLCGLPAGQIVSLPAGVLAPETRAMGMGLFFTVAYIIQLGSPWLAGHLAKSVGAVSVTFDLGAACLVACCTLLLLFQRLTVAAKTVI